MNSKILVTLVASSLALASVALADDDAKPAKKKEHAKGTHKGHVSHKSVGASEGRCDDLRKQLDDLNASYQERIGALEQEVADLQEDQHNHDTLLLDPERGSWALGLDLWWGSADGGDINYGNRVAASGGTGVATPALLSNAFRSIAGDDTAWSGTIAWQAKDDTAYRFKYTRYMSDAGYALDGANGVLGGNASAFAAPVTTLTNPNTAGATPLFSQVDGGRSVDVKDASFERDTRMFASKRFAVNWQWGARSVNVSDTQAYTYSNPGAGALFGGGGGAGATGTGQRQQYNISSQFHGWGPEAGMSGRYYLSDSFELQGGVSGAAVLGDTSFAQLLTLTAGTNIPGTQRTFAIVDNGSRTQDVKPVLDLYSKLVWHAGNHLDLNVGYQTTRYFNAITSDFGLDQQQKDLNISGFRAGVLWNFD